MKGHSDAYNNGPNGAFAHQGQLLMNHHLSCISWNIHRGRGGDGRVDPARIVDVLHREVWQAGTDALILQEADAEAAPHSGVVRIGDVEAATGLRHVQGAPSARSTSHSHGFLGVIVYLAADIMVDEVRLVDLPGVCPRGAVVVDARKAGIKIRIVATHLSLSQALRVVQMRALGQHLLRHEPRQIILCGDLNEWRPWGGLALSRRVFGQTLTGPALPSFPVRRPLLPLDRIMTTVQGQVIDARVLDGAGIRAASDHRPLRARVTLCAATSAT
jgi:endonuclease/exonuclease/phosphatase family metal-dependent hydrolase